MDKIHKHYIHMHITQKKPKKHGRYKNAAVLLYLYTIFVLFFDRSGVSQRIHLLLSQHLVTEILNISDLKGR